MAVEGGKRFQRPYRSSLTRCCALELLFSFHPVLDGEPGERLADSDLTEWCVSHTGTSLSTNVCASATYFGILGVACFASPLKGHRPS